VKQPQIQLLFEANDIQRRVKGLGQRLQRDKPLEDPLFISIVGGSVLFLADLIRTMAEPIRYEFVQVHYAASGKDGDILEVQYPISLDVSGQDILVVKDVVSTGVIESYLRSQFQQRGARRIVFAALIDVKSERTTDFEPDYRLFAAERSGVFVGYGLKYRGQWGNLSYIGEVIED
jgi:hypoxanthine phosphoribosyltransferase